MVTDSRKYPDSLTRENILTQIYLQYVIRENWLPQNIPVLFWEGHVMDQGAQTTR
jgi:hypothetical protein